MTSQIQFFKNKIRREMKTKLAALAPGEYYSFNSAIEQHFFALPFLQKFQKIMIYYSIGYEVATLSIISRLIKAGKTVALPMCTDKSTMRAGIIQHLHELKPGMFGIYEPSPFVLEMHPAEIDLAVIPGVAFGYNGVRLGHGAGYYDRFLSGTKAYKLGMAYDFQMIDDLVAESHDIPMDALVTPSLFREIRRQAVF